MVVQEYPGEASVRSGALFHMSSWYDYRLWLLANTCQRSSFYSAIITTNSAFRTKIVVYNNPSKSNCVSFECQKILESDLSYLPLSDVLRLSFHPTNKKNLDAEIDSFHVNESLLACMIHKSAICKLGLSTTGSGFCQLYADDFSVQEALSVRRSVVQHESKSGTFSVL